MIRGILMSAVILLMAGRVLALDPIVPVAPASPDSLFKDGQALEEKGDFGGALAKYQVATVLQSDFLDAHLHAINCLIRLFSVATRDEERAGIIKAIRDRYALAAKCKTADWRVYSQWASFLMDGVLPRVTAPADRDVFFEEADGLIETAITQAPAGKERGQAQLQRALMLVDFCPEITDKERQLKLYREAVEIFQAVRAADATLVTPGVADSAAVALLHVGRLSGDRAKAQTATDQLRRSVERTPKDIIKRYNLACAYAALADANAAYEQLAQCLRDDQQKLIVNAVKHDAEWTELRQTPRFRNLLAGYDPAVDVVFGQGVDFQASAEHSAVEQISVQQLQKAVAAYREATTERPDFLPAWTNLAACYQHLATLAPDHDARLKLTQATHDAYQHAAGCTGADWSLFEKWGQFLMRDVAVLMPDVAEQLKVLQQARGAFEEGLKRVKYTGDRARLQMDVATCCVRIGRQSSTDPERVRWLKHGIAVVQEAMKSDEIAASAAPYALWGVAQLDLGQIQHDRFVLRKAVERLTTALEKGGEDPEVHYNLACVHALLGETDEALRQLRSCLDQDRSGRFATIALTDHDLDNVRNEPAFAEAVNAKPASDSAAPVPPAPISNF